jgi:hypothetical protein
MLGLIKPLSNAKRNQIKDLAPFKGPFLCIHFLELKSFTYFIDQF